MTDKEHLLTEKQTAEYLQLTPRFLQARRYRGNGPPFIRISSRAIRYRLADLEEWINNRIRTSTSDQGMEGGLD